MAILTYKCNIVKDKRPKWLKLLICLLANAQRWDYEGSREDFEHLKYSLDKFLDQLRLGQTLTVRVTTEIVEDNGAIALICKRTGTPIVSVYIK